MLLLAAYRIREEKDRPKNPNGLSMAGVGPDTFARVWALKTRARILRVTHFTSPKL